MQPLLWTFLTLTAHAVDARSSAAAGKIDHIVVLMLENRSFDHMCGFLKAMRPEVDGCLPDEAACANPLDPSDASSERVPVDNGAMYVADADPDHSVSGTTFEIFGRDQAAPWPTSAPMNGFVKRYSGRGPDSGRHIMQCFDPSHVPALTTLASEFALFDRWFPAVPGPTMPNRIFAQSGTSHGMATNSVPKLAAGMPQKSIFELIDDTAKTAAGLDGGAGRQKNLDWGVYFQEVPASILFKYTRKHPLRFHTLRKFKKHAAQGRLPAFSWLEPRYYDFLGQPASDQHPDHDVAEGDRLIKTVYEALRNGPKWNSTLFVLTYDEHGGFFDHVAPPAAPSPDGLNATDDPFDFTRAGVRIPTIVASPLIPKGTLVHEPGTGGTHAGPQDNSEFEATSVIATARRLLGLEGAPLTAREAWAAPFDSILSEASPRTDCPTQLPEAPSHRAVAGVPLAPFELLGTRPLNELQRTFVEVLSMANGAPVAPNASASMTEEQGARFVASQVNALLKRDVVDIGLLHEGI